MMTQYTIYDKISQVHKHMILLGFFYLLNSIGSFVMWLVLGPYVSMQTQGMASMGHLGMVRQLAFIAGAVLGGSLADHGRPLRKQLVVEIIQFLSAIFLIFLIREESADNEWVFLSWSAIRFGFSGLSFVLGFKVLSQITNSLGNTSIVHLLLTQGATLFAPIIAFGLPFISSQPLSVALSFDALSTLGYIIVLLKALGSSYDVQCTSESPQTIFQRLRVSITAFWRPEFRPWNYLQLLMLLGLSGYAVISLQTAEHQSLLPVNSAYALCSLTYGFALWITSIWIKRAESLKMPIALGSLSLAISGAIYIGKAPEQFALASSYVFYVFGFWLLLHGTNKGLLSCANPLVAGEVRASMVFYLSVIFGLGESAFGTAIQSGYGTFTLATLRIGASLLLLLILSLPFSNLYEKTRAHA
jgi:hypothetical protein